jgi:uncharacterized membrane protein YjjP (DUF1212 family)
MTSLQERSDLVLAFARVLYINGQATDQVIAAAEQLARGLGLSAKLMPRWGELELETADADARLIGRVSANPTGVNMTRVTAAARAIGDIASGRLISQAARQAIGTIARSPGAPTWLFAVAAACGATALSVVFGIEHWIAALLIFVSAGIGALLRRALAEVSDNEFIQPFCAALVAGVIGALAVRFELSSSLRLVAVCPCMVLVPGPHVLNCALDLIDGRIHLGAARLIYAGLIIVAISTGLLLGLALLGVSLPVDENGRTVQLWEDVIAAGVAVAAYSVFFSTPRTMLPWPIAVGMFAHALHWGAITVLDWGAATGAFVACLVVGLVLTPVSHRRHMPFAAIGFASVVSMMPGVLLFRMASGLTEIAGGSHTTLELISGTVADGVSAAIIILAMSFGLITPKLVIDYFRDRSRDKT